MNRISLPITLAVSLSLTAAAGGIASADPVEIEAVSNLVSVVKNVERGDVPGQDVHAGASDADSCVAAVDEAIAAGTAPSTVVNLWYTEIPGATQLGDKWSAPLSAVRRYCTAVAASARTGAVVYDLERILTDAGTLHRDYFVDGGDPEDNWYNLEAVAKKCPATVDAALAGGLPPTQPLDVRGKKITLAQARAQCEPLVTAVGKVQAQKKAAEEAKLAPFRKALKGDKMALVLSRGTDWYGKGCRLMTAAQMAKATTWYEILVDTNGIRPRWTTRAYKFKGDKRAGNKERSGWGNDAPSSGCP